MFRTTSADEYPAPPYIRGGGVETVGGEASRAIQHFYHLWTVLKEKSLRLSRVKSTDATELKLLEELCDIVFRLYRLQVWMEYPELTGKAFDLYSDWTFGLREHRVGTSSHFPVAPANIGPS